MTAITASAGSGERITAGVHCITGILFIHDHRHNDPGRREINDFLYFGMIAGGNTVKGGAIRTFQGHNVQHGGVPVHHAVFAVDPAEIETGFCGNLGNRGISESDNASLTELSTFNFSKKFFQIIVTHDIYLATYFFCNIHPHFLNYNFTLQKKIKKSFHTAVFLK